MATQKVKVSIKGIYRFGFVREYKADKVKLALFDTPDFICPMGNGCYWGHYIKDDWFEFYDVEFIS